MDTAISYDLPELMTDYKRKKHGTGNANKMSTAKSKKWYTKKKIFVLTLCLLNFEIK